ncbi:MAG: DNA-processing protein DprA [Myxococcota bacterium]
MSETSDLPPLRTPEPRQLLPTDAEWPDGVHDLARPPRELFVAGALPPGPRVAIVGTRRADPGGLRFARRLAEGLAARGISVVSGGARGIDGAAHRGALEATAGAPTLAVLAAGVLRAYPPEHAELFARIAGRGALVSEVLHAAPQKGRFVARNRLVAALADAVVVVQAPARSGALVTARWAVKLDRPLLAAPGAPWDDRAEGANALIREGHAAPCLGLADVLRVLGRPEDPGAGTRAAFAAAPAALRPVHRALGATAQHVDDLADALGSDVASVQRALLQLLLLGLATERDGLWSRQA